MPLPSLPHCFAPGTPDNTRKWFEPGACFAKGTLVHTKEGLVPIEQIKVGDWVLSKPENGGEQAYKRVLQTFAHPPERIVDLGKVCKTPAEPQAGSWISFGGKSAALRSLKRPFSSSMQAIPRTPDALMPVPPATTLDGTSTDCSAQTTSSTEPCSWPAPDSAHWRSQTAA